jgi:DNA-binding CsgD family transcriptional regulator
MTFAVRPMSNPVQMRDIAPQWMVEAPDRDAVTASIETLCEQFGGSSAVLFRINIDQAAPKTKLIASTGIEDQFRDAFIDRAAGSVAGGGYTEILPLMIPAWKVGGASAFIYAFPGFPRAHGQLVTAILSIEQKGFQSIATTDLACRCIMEGLDRKPVGEMAPQDQPRITAREQSCLAWTAEGKTSDEIGIILDLSPHTVNHYLGSAARKLGATNRMHAVAKALRMGLIERPV